MVTASRRDKRPKPGRWCFELQQAASLLLPQPAEALMRSIGCRQAGKQTGGLEPAPGGPCDL